jgi:hypothetical protein
MSLVGRIARFAALQKFSRFWRGADIQSLARTGFIGARSSKTDAVKGSIGKAGGIAIGSWRKHLEIAATDRRASTVMRCYTPECWDERKMVPRKYLGAKLLNRSGSSAGKSSGFLSKNLALAVYVVEVPVVIDFLAHLTHRARALLTHRPSAWLGNSMGVGRRVTYFLHPRARAALRSRTNGDLRFRIFASNIKLCHSY